MEDIVIVSAARTPIGNFGGSLADVSAIELGRAAAGAAITRAGINGADIDEVIIGNVLSAGLGQNIARQVAIKAGIPIEKPAMSLGMVCGSGLRAITLAAQIIKAGDADIILAGGTESMSQAPYALSKHRFGVKMGNETLIDTMIHDGLWDAFNNYHMGITAENIARDRRISRDEQDEFALNSQRLAQKAINEGRFLDEIIGITLSQRNGSTVVFSADEYPRFDLSIEKLKTLRPAFIEDGTVTAGNTSGINDGAAMIILSSKKKADALGLPVLAKITGYSTVGVDPSIMGIGSIPAIQSVIAKANIAISDIDLIEVNEAFAAQVLVVIRELHLPIDKVNVNGGAIALGHPIGASGARILTTLLFEMKKRDVKHGLVTLCIGGGMGIAMVVER